jgi:hypothetical protein
MESLRRIVLALLVVSLGGLSAVVVTACSDEDDVEQVELSVTERDLSPGRVQVADGDIEFIVKNDGDRRHVFAVETPDGIERTDEIEPGEEARLTVELPEGRYRMYDPRGDYRARGVRGTVVVVTDDDRDTVTERTVTERTVEEETREREDVEEPPPVTITEREVQPPPRRRPQSPQPAPAPPQPQPQPAPEVPAEPPPPPADSP